MKMKKIKLTVMATAFSVMLGLSSGVVNAEVVNEAKTASNINVTRISGEDRYQTAYNIYKDLFYLNPDTKYAVVVSGDSFADAISGGLLASEYKCPVLLVSKNKLPESTKQALNDMNLNKAIIIGGENTISKKVEEEINWRTMRIAGKNRYETARLINLEIGEKKINYLRSQNASLYDWESFSDAITASSFMYEYNNFKGKNLPLYPHNKNGESKPYGLVEIAFGGENSVPKFDEKIRLSGKDRYKTAVNVAKAYKTILEKDFDTVVLANGQDYPDALASSPLSTMKTAPILLTSPKTLNEDTKQYIKSNPNIKNVIIVGGENSVSMEVENELKGLK